MSEKTPAESLSTAPLKTPAKKKDIDEIEPTELSREDRLSCFLRQSCKWAARKKKTKLDNALKEQAASQEIESWHVTESELFQKEALDFDYADIKANKSPEAHKKPSRPLVAKRILKGLEEPSVTCDHTG